MGLCNMMRALILMGHAKKKYFSIFLDEDLDILVDGRGKKEQYYNG